MRPRAEGVKPNSAQNCRTCSREDLAIDTSGNAAIKIDTTSPSLSFLGILYVKPNFFINSSAIFHLAYLWQYPANAALSINVSIPSLSNVADIAFHSSFASSSSQSGHSGAIGAGLGSFILSFLLPGLPSSSFNFTGFGLRPACIILQ